MKDINYYMSLPYKMEISKDVDGYAISFPLLPGCITCGCTVEEAMTNVEDAKRCWFEACLEDGIAIPKPM